MGKGWRNTSEVMVASFGMWGAAWVRGKNEGKRRGRLPDTYVNESECTDLNIAKGTTDPRVEFISQNLD